MTQETYKNPSYRRSDHPSFRDKRHTLLIDSQGASNREIKTESGTLRFENGVAVLPHDSRARDIYDEIQVTEALHPNQYSLVENKPTVNAELEPMPERAGKSAMCCMLIPLFILRKRRVSRAVGCCI